MLLITAQPIRNLRTPASADMNKRGFLEQASPPPLPNPPPLFPFLPIPYPLPLSTPATQAIKPARCLFKRHFIFGLFMFFLTSVLIPFFIQVEMKDIYWFIVDILEVFGFVIFCLIFVIKGVPGGCDPSGGCYGVFLGVLRVFRGCSRCFPGFKDTRFEDIPREKFFSKGFFVKKWIVSCICLSMKILVARELNNSGKGKTERDVSLSCAFYRSYFVFILSFLIQIGHFT